MTPRRRALPVAIAALALIAALLLAPAALAAAGGGTSSFRSGGGGGGFGGGGFSGAGHGHGFALYLIFRALFDIALIGHGLGLLVIVALVFAVWFMSRGMPALQAFFTARRQRGRTHRRDTERRRRRVELAAAEAADEDPIFDPDHVRPAAGALFVAIQHAWDAGNRIALRGLVAPDLLEEWERRLDDFDRKGWRNRIEVLGVPEVEYVGLHRDRGGAERVTVRIEAKLRDYVTDRAGRHVKRTGSIAESVRLREFWTLERRDDHWVLASIEQGAEGSHALRDRIVQTDWADEERLRDEAMVEQAVAEAVPDGTRIADIASLDFAGDARAQALDLSLADGRFAPDVLEIAARRAVAAWVTAVDGPDDDLRHLADATAIHQLLHPGDPSGRTRIVVRGAEVRRIRIAALDAAAEPATMTVDVDLHGHRYLEDRDTAQVLAGNPARAIDFTERWTFAVTGDAGSPWRIVAASTPAVPA